MDKKVLILYVHPNEDCSCTNGKFLATSVRILKELNWEAKFLNIYKLKFTPILDRSTFKKVDEPFVVLKELQKEGNLIEEVKEVQEMISWCDLIVLHSPVYWFGFPGVMKGFIDCVFTRNFAYSYYPVKKVYKDGLLAPKKILCCMTAGCSEEDYEKIHGDLMICLHGTLHSSMFFCGLGVLDPFVVYGTGHLSEEKLKELTFQYENILKDVDKRNLLEFKYGLKQ